MGFGERVRYTIKVVFLFLLKKRALQRVMTWHAASESLLTLVVNDDGSILRRLLHSRLLHSRLLA